MIPDSCDVDIFESAYANIGLCSDTLWMLNDSDSFQRTNQELWINSNRVKRRYNEIDSQDCLTSLKTKQVRRVRDIIPFSNLAKYGNYEYDEDRENLYAVDDTLPVYEEYSNSEETCDEPWMLPEVEEEFKRLTHVVSTEHRLWSPEVEPQASPPRPVAPDDRIWASGRWWQMESWAAILLLHYPELAQTLRDTKQSSLFSDSSQGLCRPPIEPREMLMFPVPRYRVSSPAEVSLQNRLYSPDVRGLWTTSPPRPPPPYMQPTPLTRRPPPPTLNAEVPEFFPKAPPAPLNLSVPPHIDGPRPLYFPSALGSPEELFPYRQCCSQQNTNGSPSPKNIPVYQRPPEFYAQQMEMVPGSRRQIGGVDYNNLILLTSKNQVPRRNRMQITRQQNLLDWLQDVYPERRRNLSGAEALVEELTAYEQRLVALETPPAAATPTPTPPPSDVSTPSTATATSTPSLDASSTSPSPLKRRLYRDVLANATPPSPVTAPLQSPSVAETPPTVASTSSINSLEKRYDELERQALEQYRSSEESISQRFQELERQAMEQYHCSSSSSGGSSDGEPRNCSAAPPSAVSPLGSHPAKRAQSQHELAAGGKARLAASSKSQCVIGPGGAAAAAAAAIAARPSAGKGGGDKNTAPGTAARRRLVLVSSEKRATPAPPPPTDTSDSEDGGGADRVGPRLLVVAPSSRQPCRLVAAVLDGDGGGDMPAVAAATAVAVVTAQTPEANPNERRTQVSAKHRIQSANTLKEDPLRVPETWVRTSNTTTTSSSTVEFSLGDHRRRRRRRQRVSKASRDLTPAKVNIDELDFRTRSVRRVGLVPYGFAIDVRPDQAVVDAFVERRQRPRGRRRPWPEDDDDQDEEYRSSRTIYYLTAQTLRRRASMALRRALAHWLPVTPQGAFFVDVKTAGAKHLITLTVVEDTQPEGETHRPPVPQDDSDSTSTGSDLCDDDFLCTFRWQNLLPNGNGFVATVRGILRDEKTERKSTQSSRGIKMLPWAKPKHPSVNTTAKDELRCDNPGFDVIDAFRHIISIKQEQVQNHRNETDHQRNITFGARPDPVNQILLSKYYYIQDLKKDAEIQRCNKNGNNKEYGYSTSTILFPQMVGKCVREAVRQFLLSKNRYMQDGWFRNHARLSKENIVARSRRVERNVMRTESPVVVPDTNLLQNRRSEECVRHISGEVSPLSTEDRADRSPSLSDLPSHSSASSHIERTGNIYHEDEEPSSSQSSSVEESSTGAFNDGDDPGKVPPPSPSSSSDAAWSKGSLLMTQINGNGFVKLTLPHVLSKNPSPSQIRRKCDLQEKVNDSLKTIEKKNCGCSQSSLPTPPIIKVIPTCKGGKNEDLSTLSGNASSSSDDVTSPPELEVNIPSDAVISPPELEECNSLLLSTPCRADETRLEESSSRRKDDGGEGVGDADSSSLPGRSENGSCENTSSPSSEVERNPPKDVETWRTELNGRCSLCKPRESSPGVENGGRPQPHARCKANSGTETQPSGEKPATLTATERNSNLATSENRCLQLESDSGSYKTTISSPTESDESCYDTLASSSSSQLGNSSRNTTPSPAAMIKDKVNQELLFLSDVESGRTLEGDVTPCRLDKCPGMRNAFFFQCSSGDSNAVKKYLETGIPNVRGEILKGKSCAEKKEKGRMLTNIRVLKKRILKRREKIMSTEDCAHCGWESADSYEETEAANICNGTTTATGGKHDKEEEEQILNHLVDFSGCADNCPRHGKTKQKSACVIQ